MWTTVAGVVWIAVMTVICYIGIEISAAVQRWLLFIEVAVLMLFAVAALVRVYASDPAMSIHVSVSWFNPFRVPSAEALTSGILAAVFIYWGWDTAVTVNEETADSTRIPGRAAVISVMLLLILYALVATSAQAFAGVGSAGIGLGNEENAADVLSGLGDAVFGSEGVGPALSKLLILMVLTSAVASTQTTILPMARTVFSMAAHKAIPSRFARVHRRYLTPTWSTISLGLASIGFFVLLTVISRDVLADSIGSVGLAIAFYYGLTGFACVWYFRRVLTRSRRDFLFKGLLPGLGALTMLFLFVYAAFVVYADPEYGATFIDLPLIGRTGGVTVIGLGFLLLGVALMLVVTREHTAALRLQRDLLPHRLPQRTAVEIASRYVPADSRSGVGGDWFDVIPLSGTRVGLVVGEVIGHGLLAAATMGRLRSGVRILARLDLAPDELLSRLDDLVGQTATEQAAAQGTGGARPREDEALGVTCLYAVYDPVSGQCSMVRAGPSAGRGRPAGQRRRHVSGAPVGPPLGLGGLPYEATEFQLPQGSLLAFFTDGLVQAAGEDIDVGLGVLADILVQSRRPLQELCDRAVATMVPGPHERRRGPAPRTHTDARRPPGGRVGAARGAGGGRPRPRPGPGATRNMGAGRAVVHHRTHCQRAGHQRHPLRRRADPRPAHPRPDSYLRGLRHRAHLTPSAPCRHRRRERPRPVHRRPDGAAVGHALHAHRQDHLGGAGPAGRGRGRGPPGRAYRKCRRPRPRVA